MKLTRALIDAGRSQAGGFNGKQVRLLGLEWKNLRHGWIDRLVGTEISSENYAQFLAAKSPPRPKQLNFLKDARNKDALAFANSDYEAHREDYQ